MGPRWVCTRGRGELRSRGRRGTVRCLANGSAIRARRLLRLGVGRSRGSRGVTSTSGLRLISPNTTPHRAAPSGVVAGRLWRGRKDLRECVQAPAGGASRRPGRGGRALAATIVWRVRSMCGRRAPCPKMGWARRPCAPRRPYGHASRAWVRHRAKAAPSAHTNPRACRSGTPARGRCGVVFGELKRRPAIVVAVRDPRERPTPRRRRRGARMAEPFAKYRAVPASPG